MTQYTVHPTAIVDEGAQIGADTRIWHWVHICSGASNQADHRRKSKPMLDDVVERIVEINPLRCRWSNHVEKTDDGNAHRGSSEKPGRQARPTALLHSWHRRFRARRHP